MWIIPCMPYQAVFCILLIEGNNTASLVYKLWLKMRNLTDESDSPSSVHFLTRLWCLFQSCVQCVLSQRRKRYFDHQYTCQCQTPNVHLTECSLPPSAGSHKQMTPFFKGHMELKPMVCIAMLSTPSL